jgi:glycosyltransferase involved in cell wall biosynthesis
METISVIIPSFNRAHLLPKTIPTYVQDGVCEIIIIDDFSTDNTEQVVASLQKEIPIIKYIKATKKVFQTGAKNIGIRNAIGDYCCFGDDDSILKPGSIQSLLKTSLEYKDSLVGARHICLKPEDDIDEFVRDSNVYEFKDISDFIDRKRIKINSYKKYDRVIEVPFCMFCFLLPTKIAKKQLFYEGYVGTCNREETDYIMQICINFGFKVMLDNEALSLDLPRTLSTGGTRSVKSYKRHFLEIYNEYLFWKRNRIYLETITDVNPNPIIRSLSMLINKFRIKC